MPVAAEKPRPYRRPLAIRHYLILLLGTAMLPLLLLSVGLAWRFAVAERQRFTDSISATTAIVTAAIDREVIGHRETLEALASAPALTAGDLEAFHRQATGVTNLNGIGVILRDPSGRQVANSFVPWGEPLPTTSNLTAWDERVLQEKRPIVSDHYVGLVGGRHSFAVVVPVMRDGRVTYLMHLSIPVTRLRDVLLDLGLEPGWIAAVLDRNGVVLARSQQHEDRVGKRSILQPLPRPGQPVAGRMTDAEGLPRLFAARVSGASDLIVVTAAEVELVEAPLRRSWWLLGVVAAVLVGLSLLLAHLLGDRLAEAIRMLARLGEAMGRGGRPTPPPTPIAEVNAVSQALTDAAEARETEDQRQRLILDEMHHRVKNTLSTVQALMLLTAREAPDVQAFCDRMAERLRSLSLTQELLRGSGGMTADLRAVLLAELAMHDSDGVRRIAMSGPSVPLQASAAAALGMLFHELATNAAKYGALSVPTGHLALSWTLLPGRDGEPSLEFAWEERNGPPVIPPTRQGFGTQLIERGLARQLRAETRFTFRPEGLCFRLRMPLPAMPDPALLPAVAMAPLPPATVGPAPIQAAMR